AAAGWWCRRLHSGRAPLAKNARNRDIPGGTEAPDLAAGAPHSRNRRRWLLQLDLGAGSFELLLQLFGFRLANAFLHGLRRTFDEVLGFLQAETGDGAHFLDRVDLVGTAIHQDDIEF